MLNISTSRQIPLNIYYKCFLFSSYFLYLGCVCTPWHLRLEKSAVIVEGTVKPQSNSYLAQEWDAYQRRMHLASFLSFCNFFFQVFCQVFAFFVIPHIDGFFVLASLHLLMEHPYPFSIIYLFN